MMPVMCMTATESGLLPETSPFPDLSFNTIVYYSARALSVTASWTDTVSMTYYRCKQALMSEVMCAALANKQMNLLTSDSTLRFEPTCPTRSTCITSKQRSSHLQRPSIHPSTQSSRHCMQHSPLHMLHSVALNHRDWRRQHGH